jgi:putative endonuclease
MDIYTTYVLKSLKDKKYYIGYTSNFIERMHNHLKGLVESTKNRRPFIIVYCEVCFNKDSAIRREKYLKTSYGHRYLKNRIPDNSPGLDLNDLLHGARNPNVDTIFS